MGVGQPHAMKLKNVHLPHPHPNGGFLDSSLGGASSRVSLCTDSKSLLGGKLVLPLCLAALVVVLSEVSAPHVVAASDVPSGVVFLRTSTKRGAYIHANYHVHSDGV